MSTPTAVRTHRTPQGGLFAAAMLGSLLALSGGAATAQSPSPADPSAAPAASPAPYPATVAPPSTEPMGATYAEWTERWWGWLLDFPADEDPSLATTCPVSPADGPLILPQTFFGMVQQIDCTIEAGRSLLVSAGGTICTAEPEDTDATLLACAVESDATFSSPSIAVDGRLLPDIEDYHVFTESFDLMLTEDNVLGVPAGSLRSAATGWVAMLSDLAPGTHTIVLRDEMTDPVLGAQSAEAIITVEVTE